MYELSQLFFYRPLFMAELVIAEYMFAGKLKHRKHFALRILASFILCFGTAFAIPVVAFNTLYGSVMFLVMFAVTVGAMALIYDAPFKDILCCAIAGFTVQHVAQEIYEIFSSAVNAAGYESFDFYGSGQAFGQVDLIFFLLINFQIFFLIYFIAYWIFCYKIKKQEVFALNNLTVTVIAVLFVFINVVFGAVIIWSLPQSVTGTGVIMMHVYSILCCVLALIMLFELPRRKRAENELALVRQMNHLKSEQYRISKENVELINLKCHDLKHQIRRFRNSENVTTGELDELERIIEIYDSTYQTGNEALNIILMEKSLVCSSENINLSCIVDAVQLNFLADADVYALFGNLLDNAIEAVRALPQDERSIGLSVKRIKGFTAIHIYNGYSGELKFEKGLPVTIKDAKAYHGYGLKSVKHTVEKYDGTMRVSAENSVFNIKILFPVTDENTN
jgi:signal transduction histidine kinase